MNTVNEYKEWYLGRFGHVPSYKLVESFAMANNIKIVKSVEVLNIKEYKVECQTLIELKIHAESKEEAEQIAGTAIIDHCLCEADSIDWCISAYEVQNAQ